MSKQSDEIRVLWKENDAKRDAGLTTPDTVVRYDNLLYGPDKDWQLLDVYRPKNLPQDKKLPVIVSFHGGAWVYGDKDLYQFYCMSLVEHGFAVVNFTYRLAPEFKFPASMQDSVLVMNFIVSNADKYGFDLKNVFGVGDSAGAHLCSLFSCYLTNPSFRKTFDFEPPMHGGKIFTLKGVALNCGTYDFVADMEDVNGHGEIVSQDLLQNGGTREELSSLDVLTHITKDFPPAFVMTSSADFLKAESLPLCSRLMENNVPFEFRFWHGGSEKNQCAHVFHVNMRHPFAKKCNAEECGFFKGLM